MFPYDLMPIKEGEHVYVIFEESKDGVGEAGVWLARAPEPNQINNLNYTPGAKRYVEDNDDLEAGTAATERVVQDLEEDPEVPEVSAEFQQETDAVPEFRARVGDRVIQGSNNTTIVLSRDRVDTVESGKTEEAGSIDIVAGRTNDDGDMSISDDKARIYVTMKSDIDSNFEISTDYDDDGESSGVVAKADEIRLVARKGFKIMVGEGNTAITIDPDGKIALSTAGDVELLSDGECKVSAANNLILLGQEVHVGSDAFKMVRAENLKTLLTSVFDLYNGAIVDVAGIPALGVMHSAVGTAVNGVIDSQWSLVESETIKVK
jgi:hypothetical protein